MTTTDLVATLALMVSCFTLALELKRWFDAGPKLKLSVMGDAVVIPDDDGEPKLLLTVVNRGDTPTTITHMIAFTFTNRWRYLRKRPTTSGVVNSTLMPVPSEVGINKTFMGMMRYNEKLMDARKAGHLYVGVYANHSNRPFLIRVPGPTPARKLVDVNGA